MAAGVLLYHNPRCSKSREVLALLEKKKVKPEVVLYLDTPLTEAELKALVEMLGIPASELLRKKEPLFIEKFAGRKLTPSQCIKAMAKYPILMERPVVVKGNKAVIGRPAEKALELLG